MMSEHPIVSIIPDGCQHMYNYSISLQRSTSITVIYLFIYWHVEVRRIIYLRLAKGCSRLCEKLPQELVRIYRDKIIWLGTSLKKLYFVLALGYARFDIVEDKSYGVRSLKYQQESEKNR